MASTARLGLGLVVVSIILSILSGSATARPCKTLLISSYYFSIKPLYNKNDPNNPSSGFVAIVTRSTTRHVRGSSEIFLGRGRFFPVAVGDHVGSFDDDRRQREEKGAASSILPLWVSSSSSSSSSSPAVTFYDMSSLRDRARDVLSVVVAMLFGVGCGALTAATMYLIWSLFATTAGYNYYPYIDDGESSGSEGEEEDDVKKLGYVKIPEAAEADSVAKPLKEAAAAAV